MAVVVVNLPSDGQVATAEQYNGAIDAILAQVNGNLDDNNIASMNGSKIVPGSLPATALSPTASQGWLPISTALTSIANQGNRSYTGEFANANLTTSLSPGMRFMMPRSTPPPTQCTSLNGSTQYWNNTSVSGITFTNQFTIAGWIKCTALTNNNQYIVSRYSGGNGFGFAVSTYGEVGLIGWNGGSGNLRQIFSTASIPLNRWVKVSASIDMADWTTATCTVQLDDVNVPISFGSTGSNPTSMVQAGNLEVGSISGGTDPFNGEIAQLEIFNALIPASTLATYSGQTITGSESSCVGAWTFNGVATDLSVNGNNLSSNGSALATTVDSPMNATEYGILTAASYTSPNTFVTIQVPANCTLPQTTGLNTPSYSTQKAPYGFPMSSGKWEILYLQGATVIPTTSSTSVQLNSGQIFVPIGSWDMEIQAACVTAGGDGYMGVSTSPTSGADEYLTQRFYNSGLYNEIKKSSVNHNILTTVGTTYYVTGSKATGTSIGSRGYGDDSSCYTKIIAKNNYL